MVDKLKQVLAKESINHRVGAHKLFHQVAVWFFPMGTESSVSHLPCLEIFQNHTSCKREMPFLRKICHARKENIVACRMNWYTPLDMHCIADLVVCSHIYRFDTMQHQNSLNCLLNIVHLCTHQEQQKRLFLLNLHIFPMVPSNNCWTLWQLTC